MGLWIEEFDSFIVARAEKAHEKTKVTVECFLYHVWISLFWFFCFLKD